MKSTYKLLGTHWDGMPMPSRGLAIVDCNELASIEGVNDIASISAHDLLATKTTDDVDMLLASVAKCGEVAVLDDSEPESGSGVLHAFYRKRLLQACAYVQRKVPHARIVLMENCARKAQPPILGGGKRIPVNTLARFIQLSDKYAAYLTGKGILLDADGFPLLDRSCFLDEWPNQVVTYKYRNSSLVTDKAHTALCFFAPDQQIYPRLVKVLEEIGEYRQYLGVVMPDTTVTADMDPEWQAATILLNQLFMAVLAVNGVKVVANIRCGSPGTERYLRSIPKDVMWASGRLGCGRLTSEADFSYVAKVLSVAPAKLMLYGPPDKKAEAQLDMMGVDYRRYPDVHAQYGERKHVA